MSRRFALPSPNAILVCIRRGIGGDDARESFVASLLRARLQEGTSAESAETLARVRVCRTSWERIRGLIGYAPLPPGLGLVVPRCGAIHTAFVAGPIDALFLWHGHIVGMAEELRPWRIAGRWGAQVTVELAPGSIRQWSLRVGDLLEVRPEG